MSETAEIIWKGIAVGVGAAIAVFAILAFVAILFLLGWNLGVVGLVAACGATVSKIGFWTAFGGAIVTSFLKSILGNDVKVNKTAS